MPIPPTLRSLATLLPLVLAAASCGYSPPANTNTELPKYRADLETCDGSVPDAVDKRNAKRGLTWAGGGFTRWGQIDDAMTACMGGKGWGRIRACTADELRNGNRTGILVVTQSGIRCSDPNKPS